MKRTLSYYESFVAGKFPSIEKDRLTLEEIEQLSVMNTQGLAVWVLERDHYLPNHFGNVVESNFKDIQPALTRGCVNNLAAAVRESFNHPTDYRFHLRAMMITRVTGSSSMFKEYVGSVQVCKAWLQKFLNTQLGELIIEEYFALVNAGFQAGGCDYRGVPSLNHMVAMAKLVFGSVPLMSALINNVTAPSALLGAAVRASIALVWKIDVENTPNCNPAVSEFVMTFCRRHGVLNQEFFSSFGTYASSDDVVRALMPELSELQVAEDHMHLDRVQFGLYQLMDCAKCDTMIALMRSLGLEAERCIINRNKFGQKFSGFIVEKDYFFVSGLIERLKPTERVAQQLGSVRDRTASDMMDGFVNFLDRQRCLAHR